MQIEEGIEVFIPQALSQDSLPMSFQYYDHILGMVAENISKEKRIIMAERQQLAKQLYYLGDMKVKLLIKMGIMSHPN